VLLLLTVVDADVAPAGTVTDAAVHSMVGTELERATTTPPGRALEVRVTVIRVVVPPMIEAADKVTLESACRLAGGLIVSVAVFVTPFADAVKVTAVDAATAAVVTATLALVAPAGTNTAGTIGATLTSELVRRTSTPVEGAALVSVTVSIDVLRPPPPPEARETLARAAGGATVTVVDLLMPE
jgi:hypothetical protein